MDERITDLHQRRLYHT